MNAPEQWVISYWLLPALPFQDFFRETIQRLAAEYDAPIFNPHVTLTVRPDAADEAEAKLATLPDGAVELDLREVAWASKFTRTLFVRFDSSAPLLQLRSSLGADPERDFDPHLSLLYKRLPEEEQARLAAEVRCPFATVVFDSVAATLCRTPVETPADVAVWKTLAARHLVQ